jgi:hypothetical protein
MSETVRPEHAERVRDFYREQGARAEQKRIIELLEPEIDKCWCNYLAELVCTAHLHISLIKGETRE